MKKTIARGLSAVILLGALSGVLAGGTASATLNCRSVGPYVLLCTDTADGVEVIEYSDYVEVHTRVLYGINNETGILVGDGFTTQASGAFVSCDKTKHKYRLTYVVIGSYKNRKLAVRC